MKKDLVKKTEKLYHPINYGLEELLGMNSMINNFFKDWGHSKVFMPRTDVIEKEDLFEITLEIPGIDDNNIDISVEENILIIKGNKVQKEITENDNMHITERVFGEFERRFSLPKEINSEQISAKINNGILTITIPKIKEDKPSEKKITITKE